MPKLNTRLTASDRNDFKTIVNALLQRRKQLVQPIWDEFDNDPYEIYRAMLPPDINTAIDLINTKLEGKFAEFLETNTEITVQVRDQERATKLCFYWGDRGSKPAPRPDWSSKGIGLTISDKHPMAAKLIEFSKKCWALDKQNADVYELVCHTVDRCGTFGQIHRVWPDLLPIITSEKIAAAGRQQRQSSLPYYLDADSLVRNRDEYTMYLAQASVLPKRPTSCPPVWAQ